jgi:hypothetical protein
LTHKQGSIDFTCCVAVIATHSPFCIAFSIFFNSNTNVYLTVHFKFV